MQFGRTRVGIVTYSDRAKVMFRLGKYKTMQELMNGLSFSRSGGRTNTQEALRYMYQDVFSRSGDRRGVDNIAIVVSDGGSNVSRGRKLAFTIFDNN